MIIQGNPSILSPVNSPMTRGHNAFSGLGGFGAANVTFVYVDPTTGLTETIYDDGTYTILPTTSAPATAPTVAPVSISPTTQNISDAQIASYVQGVLNDSTLTTQQMAQQIAQTAQANNVNVGDIARATGYDTSTVTSFLQQAMPTAQPQPAPDPSTYAAPTAPIFTSTASTPAPAATPTPDAINSFVQSVLNDPTLTTQQMAQQIANTAANNGVTTSQIAAATGYDVNTVQTFLAQSVPTTTPATVSPAPVGKTVTFVYVDPTTGLTETIYDDGTYTILPTSGAAPTTTTTRETDPRPPVTVSPTTTALQVQPAPSPIQTTAVTPAQTAPTNSQINNFVQTVLTDPTLTIEQQATSIANTAIQNNVTVSQLVNATGYDLPTTLNFLSQAQIDTSAAAFTPAYQSFVQAVATQNAAQHVTTQAAATTTQVQAAAVASATTPTTTSTSLLMTTTQLKAQQDAALAKVQAALLQAQQQAATDAAALAKAQATATTTPTKANVDLVALLNKKSSDSTQLVATQTNILKTAGNQVASGQTVTVTPAPNTTTTTTTNFLPILAVAAALFMGQ